ncbi:MAG: hypothetical protein ACRDKY_06150, partial [Solirubrobacteraceae bacterium]
LACGICAGATIAAALGATVAGRWVIAGGCSGIALACLGAWLWVTRRSADSGPDDGDDSDDDGGGGRLRRPLPPAPSTPLGGPPTDWTQFDRARAAWEKPRVPADV